MQKLFLDPVVLMLPEHPEKQADYEQWLLLLDSWLAAIQTSQSSWYHLRELLPQLSAAQRFPSFHLLQQWQQRYQMDINLARISRAINAFIRDEMRDLGRIFDQVGILISLQEEEIEITPQALTQRWFPELERLMASHLGQVAVYKALDRPEGCGWALVSLPLPVPSPVVTVAAVVETLVLETEHNLVPEAVCEEFPLVCHPKDLEHSPDVCAIFQKGEAAVISALGKTFEQQGLGSIARPLPFRLGARFLLSVKEAGLLTNEEVLAKLLRYGAAVIAEKARDLNCNLRHLKESKGPQSPQRIRAGDGAKAWRLTITSRGAGWRLHYWQIPTQKGSMIEFANVLKKTEPEVIF